MMLAMFRWHDDLFLPAPSLHIDSRRSRPRCFVSHAHSDHLPQDGPHERAIATPQTIALAEHRIEKLSLTESDVASDQMLDADTLIRLLPAGHVLGSAMIRIERPEGALLYTGDFKMRSSLTVAPAAPEPADILVMESTYGLPVFRFPHWKHVHARLIELVAEALAQGRQPIVLGYSLGKAQEIVRILTDHGLTVTCHGAVAGVNDIYQSLGMPLGAYKRYRSEDFHGSAALDLAERGVLVAPPQVARSAFVSRFANPLTIMMSGWGMQKNAKYRYGVDEVLPLSDHADFDELLELVERVSPRKVYTHHGYREFAETLRAMGIDAELARPEAQLRLFD